MASVQSSSLGTGLLSITYWAFAILLCCIGVLGMASIGAPFLLLGLTLLILGRWRSRRFIFWPILFAVLAAIAAYLFVVPARCTATTVGTSRAGGPTIERTHTTCTNVFGDER